MLVDASSIRNDSVFTSDSKKIGTIMNVILKCASGFPRFSILVFPAEQNWLEDYIEKNWGKLTIDSIKKAFPAKIPEILDDIKDKGLEEAERVWNDYSKDNITKAQQKLKKCYLIPGLAIEESKRTKKEIVLKIDLDRVENQFGYIGEPRVSTTHDMAFFSASNIARRDAEILLPVTLNLSAIQDLEVQDCDGNTGNILDIQLDFEHNEVAKLVVLTSAKRLVSADDFDFSTLTSNKAFNSCAELPFT